MATKVSLTRRERALVVCFRTTDDEGRRTLARRASWLAKNQPTPNDLGAARRFERATKHLALDGWHVYDLLV